MRGIQSLFIIILVLLMSVPAAFAQQDNPLAGTAWRLVSINGAELMPGTEITLLFENEGSAGGSSGCNFYGVDVAVEQGNSIRFTQAISTAMACLDEGVMEQESAYLQALEAVATYAVRDGQRVLVAENGDELVFDVLPQLPGSQWHLVSLGDEAVLANSEITLQFDDSGSAAGTGGCNSYGTTYTANGQSITFTPAVATEMACLDEGIMAQEIAYFAALAEASSYTLTDDALTIVYGDKALVFAPLLNLAGTAWQLTSINNEAAESATPVTIQFEEDGSVVGFGGCNQYGSRYTLTGNQISFEPIVSTRMACADPAMAAETAYFAALQAAAQVELSNDTLTLITAEGTKLVFAPSLTISDQP